MHPRRPSVLFTEPAFAVLFATVLVAYFALPLQRQNVLLLIASYVFYGWWDWRFLTLLAASTVVDYLMALWIERAYARGSSRDARRAVTISVVTNLTILGFFKYFDFFLESAEHALRTVGYEGSVWTLGIILPVGISFYTFQSMAYTIDVYRRELPACRSLLEFALYVSFFPQLVAGPIERAQRLLPQIQSPRVVTRQDWQEGLLLFGIGFFRKLAIADPAGLLANTYFSRPDMYASVPLAAGLGLYALQIYNDFAGYSDMARGTARMLGFSLIRNFRHPYFASSPSDFWRRWHVSLSAWLRDYLYIPLGGNRRGRLRTYLNLMVTMALGGLWHGANWTFVVWGGIHGAYLVLQHAWTGVAPRLASIRSGQGPPAARSTDGERWSVTGARLAASAGIFILVTFAWVFFRAADLGTAMIYLSGLLALKPGAEGALIPFVLLAFFTLAIDAPQSLADDEYVFLSWSPAAKALATSGAVVLLLMMNGSGDVPFIYFQF